MVEAFLSIRWPRSNCGAWCHAGMRLPRMNAAVQNQCEGDYTNWHKPKSSEKVSIRSDKCVVMMLCMLACHPCRKLTSWTYVRNSFVWRFAWIAYSYIRLAFLLAQGWLIPIKAITHHPWIAYANAARIQNLILAIWPLIIEYSSSVN